MNIRSLTRSDGAVIGAAVLLLAASFLAFFKAEAECSEDCSVNSWDPSLLPLLPTVTLTALIAAALVVVGRLLPEGRRVAGLGPGQWGTALAVFACWAALWSMFGDLVPDPQDRDLNRDVGLGVGAWLNLLGTLAMAASAVLGDKVPALRAPLLPAPRPQQAAGPYGQVPPQGGYGYPGGPQPTGPHGAYGHPAGPQPAQHQPYGGAQPTQQFGQPLPGGGGAPVDPGFQPFWFAVPVARPLFAEDGSPSPVAELAPGTWYLAVEQRGQALVAQTQDGRRGILRDASGIQRG